MKTENEVHPADKLAAALNRASVLLSALIDLYDGEQESFVGGNSFIAHGVSTANELLDEAGRALADLHEKCDLSLVDEAPAPNNTAQPTPQPAKPETVKAAAKPPATIAAAVVTLQEGKNSPEEAAQGYRELLGKIAKVEANGALAHSQAPSPATAELLPMLQALRKEIQKVSGVA